MRSGLLVIRALTFAAVAFATAARPAPATETRAAVSAAQSLHARQVAFLRTVDRHDTANLVTGDLVRFAGTHIAYSCDVDSVVETGLILGQCGSDAEPIDFFVHLPTTGIRKGDRLQILGVMENPAMWTDINGHTVYYAFIKALFVNRR